MTELRNDISDSRASEQPSERGNDAALPFDAVGQISEVQTANRSDRGGVGTADLGASIGEESVVRGVHDPVAEVDGVADLAHQEKPEKVGSGYQKSETVELSDQLNAMPREARIQHAEAILSGHEAPVVGSIQFKDGSSINLPPEAETGFTAKRLDHTLTGWEHSDTVWSGGHLYPGPDPNKYEPKTAFPESWTPNKIVTEVYGVIGDPQTRWEFQDDPATPGELVDSKGKPIRIRGDGVGDGQQIRVVLEPAGEGIVTCFISDSTVPPARREFRKGSNQ